MNIKIQFLKKLLLSEIWVKPLVIEKKMIKVSRNKFLEKSLQISDGEPTFEFNNRPCLAR